MFGLPNSTITILSIDGGGIRGLIPALILKELEERLARRRNAQPLPRLFDLMAGTSTGGLIALGLCAPAISSDGHGYLSEPALTTDDLIRIYTDRGEEIFPPWKFRRLRSVLQAFGDKYDADGLARVLQDSLGDVTVHDALTNVLITSYDTERRTPHLFKSRPRARGDEDLNFYMRDAARATAAAPTFFEPAHIKPVPENGESYCLVDGAVLAQNPALTAYVEARKIFPQAKRFVILSLGTGQTVHRFSYSEMRNWGYLDWVSPVKGVPLSSMMTDAQSESANHQLARLPDVQFFRLDGELHGVSDAMDDASSENIMHLRRLAFEIMHNHSEKLDRVCDILSRR